MDMHNRRACLVAAKCLIGDFLWRARHFGAVAVLLRTAGDCSQNDELLAHDETSEFLGRSRCGSAVKSLRDN
jgi:hypothetical protein